MSQEIEVAAEETQAIQKASEMSVEEIVNRVSKVHEVQRQVMKEGTHYGKVPGIDKPTLLKPGAEILGMVFMLDPQFEVTEHRDGDHLTAVVKCTVYHQGTGARLGSGLGSCSTKESKYAYRKGSRKCPACDKEGTIIKGKAEYGGGWLCWAKKGGCGAKFDDGDESIEGQQTDRVPNPDLYDQHNTVLKMAIKRAHVAAILFVTCASEIFTQDLEDLSGSAGSAAEPKKEVSIEGLLSAYADCTTARQLEQADSAVSSMKSSLTEFQLKALRRAHNEAFKRIKASQENAEADDTERAMG